jgi:hypothetical protein
MPVLLTSALVARIAVAANGSFASLRMTTVS